MKRSMKVLWIVILMAGVFLGEVISAFAVTKADPQAKKPNVKIAVISDIHYFSPDLFIKGKAFDEYIEKDRKLIAESDDIFRKAIDSIKASDAGIVLIPGDLTKDGEMIDHQVVAGFLEELRSAGKKVYVIDGNHDVNNPGANIYSSESTRRIRNTTPEEFKKVYNSFGYKDAIAKDPDSLSYVVEPVKGIRIIAMDSCSYDTNAALGQSVISGEFTQKRLDWIKKQLKDAKDKGATIIGMTHHGIVQHFDMQEVLFPEYLIKDWRNVSEQLADLGMNVVFTGHFHAQDIVQKKTKRGNTIFDVETGSLVTYPNPYRIIDITNDNKMKITSKRIDSINYDLGGASFQNFSKEFLVSNMKKYAPMLLIELLIRNGVTIDKAMAEVLTLSETQPGTNVTAIDIFVNAMCSNYQGDEAISSAIQTVITQLSKADDPGTKLLALTLKTISTDLPPGDNNLTVNLVTGETIK
jgi:3',5'-cyclic AMP phosphodiesterase CpdA